jgi:hypothetical protein
MDHTIDNFLQNGECAIDLDNPDNVDSICLNNLYPEDSRNLNDLFPEKELRILFRDVVSGIEDVRRFVENTERTLGKPGKKQAFGKTTKAGQIKISHRVAL